MKKKSLKSLKLNKKIISNFNANAIVGGISVGLDCQSSEYVPGLSENDCEILDGD